MESFLSKLRAARANSLIPEETRGGRIVDIGCGLTPYFLIHTQFNEKHALEREDLISDHHTGIKLHRINLEEETNLPFDDNYFDIVTMLAVFEHINTEKLPQLLVELHRILRVGGLLIITTPHPRADVLLWIMAKLNLVSKEEINEHKRTYRQDELQAILMESGFDESKIKTGYFEFFLNNWLTAKK